MRAFRSLVAFVVPALAGIGILLCAPVLGTGRSRNLATRVIGDWGCALAGIRIYLDDPGNQAGHRPAVFVFNHQSGVDPVVLCAVFRADVVGVAKRELRRHPLLGPLLALAGTVFVDRDAGRGSRDLASARSALQRGLAVAIAPEGHRRSGLGRFRPGALRLAAEAGVALIPVVIHDSARVLPPRRWLMRPGTVQVDILPALDASRITLDQLEAAFHERLAP
jgi:putative phosphoserine phosphatase/1-acylglycerol-3-phosphate O-acyltransferase